MRGLLLKSKKHGDRVVLYDNIDHDLISAYHWYLFKNGNSFYAMSTLTNRPNGKAILMHRLIMDITNSKVLIDHKNQNGLDNTRDNLRVATKAQNSMNSKIFNTNSSGYRGVDVIDQQRNMFRARISIKGKNIHIGCFKTAIDAAMAYNAAAISVFGEFACLNQV